MNERMLALLKQSGAYDHYEINPGVDGDELPMIKFAELIVRDCANYAFSDDQERNAMLAHFGVEEPKEFEVWICEKCGADRTKEPCQLAVEGKTVYGNCPIVGVAQ